MVDEQEPLRRRALLNPIELCITAIKTLLRQPLERFGEVMFNRGVRYERDRAERRASGVQPLNPPVTEAREYDFDKTQVSRPPRQRDDTTPTRPVRSADLEAFAHPDERDPAKEAVVPPLRRDPRSK